MSEIAACTLIQEEPDRKTERYMMMFKDYPDVVSVDILQEMLGICRKNAYLLVKQNKIHSARVGRSYKIVPYFEPLHYTLQDMEQHPKYIQDFYQHELDRGLTANTVIHYHANIRKCLQYAFQIGMIRSNPADRVERPRKEKFKSEIYSGEELEQLFKVIQGDPSEFGVIMAAFYGLRRSEIVGLKWDAIDFENKKISIQHTVVTAKVNGTVTEIARDKTKTKSSCRTLPLIPACEQMLNKMKKEQEQNRKVCGKSYCTDYLDYIYVDPTGKRIRPDFLSQHFPDFLVAHQMKRIRFHDLRHSCASLLYANGVSLKEIKSGSVTVTSAQQATFIHIWISPVRCPRRMQSSISSQKTPKYKKLSRKRKTAQYLSILSCFMMECRWWDSNPHGFPNDFESFASAIPPHRLIFNFGTLVPVSEDWRDVQEGCKKSCFDKLSKFNEHS